MSNLSEPITETINKNVEPPSRCKIGRPKKIFIEYTTTDKKEMEKEYKRLYYKNNKEKFIGDYHCITCNILCAIGNKSRHNKSFFHLDNLKVIS